MPDDDKDALVRRSSVGLAKNDVISRGLKLATDLVPRKKVLLLRDFALGAWFDVVAKALSQQFYDIEEIKVETAEEALEAFANATADLAIVTSNPFISLGHDASYVRKFFAANNRTHLLLWSAHHIFLDEALKAFEGLSEETNRLECVSLDLGLKQVVFAVNNTVKGGPHLHLA